MKKKKHFQFFDPFHEAEPEPAGDQDQRAEHAAPADEEASESPYATGEHRGGEVYDLDKKTVFAVQVAQITGRPLLLQGPAGSGKSSLAPYVARALKCRFYSFTVTARSQARDLMWEFDALRRLSDANVGAGDPEIRERVKVLENYITPRELWWALNRESAGELGTDPATRNPKDPEGERLQFENNRDVVLLIDEIDKADPDVPNNLLEVLGSSHFTIAETGARIDPAAAQYPLIMITTNNERELPLAFLRRCIVLHLDHKDANELSGIAKLHFGTDDSELYLPVAKRLIEIRDEAIKHGQREPSTAEYLDALRACLDRGIKPDSANEKQQELWTYLIEIGVRKSPEKKEKKRSS